MADKVKMAKAEGSDLFVQMQTFDYGDDERRDLMIEVWSPTPWIVDAFSDSVNSVTERAMLDWCRAAFGDEAWPIHGRPGEWQRGSATIHGWTWFGFRTEGQMNQFNERFPTPLGLSLIGGSTDDR